MLGLAAVLTGLTLSCVEPYELDYALTKRIVIIDGFLTDNPLASNNITLKESIPNSGKSFFSPLKQALVEVVVNDTERILFKETADGIYQKPSSLTISSKKNYRLEFTTKDGRSYRSSEESFQGSSTITRVYTQLEIESLPKPNGEYEPAHSVFLDTKDTPGKGNNFVWSWSLYEKQSVCESCNDGRYFIDARRGNGCRNEPDPARPNGYIYDYACDSPCWQIFKSSQINAIADTYVDGQPIIGRFITKIPIYQSVGALLEVRQQSVSPGAFRYLKLLAEQSQNNGGLADTPPAALIGNVQNTKNKEEVTGGYFTVAGESVNLLWIDREDVRKQKLPVRGLLGHVYSPEPTTDDLSRPPLAPCVNSATRTKNQPRGWVN